MRNPWTTKNPFMSVWLSSANKVANTARGQAAAATKRHVATTQADLAKQVIDFWSEQGDNAASSKEDQAEAALTPVAQASSGRPT